MPVFVLINRSRSRSFWLSFCRNKKHTAGAVAGQPDGDGEDEIEEFSFFSASRLLVRSAVQLPLPFCYWRICKKAGHVQIDMDICRCS